ESEPVVLPGAFPNLLANGAAGIAVGMATSIPPHNAGEVCAAALHLVRNPQATTRELLAYMKGPDFPTGGTLAEDAGTIETAYETGRGSLRLRARWEVERARHGTWSVVVTEIPYQVQKARLIEQIAQLLEEKKLPLLGDVRDESTEDVRIVLEPKTRAVEPEVLMASLFRATQLETRFGLNMNVLDANRTPRVMSLAEVLRAWLDHRHEVLVRRSRHRLAAIEKRLLILEGFLAVYLNLDEVIRIIRSEDEPKPVLMQTFGLVEEQAEAILNMRLRSLRKLEEVEIRREHKTLGRERKELKALLDDAALRWKRVCEEIERVRKQFADGPLGVRRTRIAEAPHETEFAVAAEALIEREAITAILSEKGWIRAVKGAVADPAELRFKDGDRLKAMVACETTDRLTLFATNGRAYPLRAGDLPRGRGDGQAIRLLAELANEDDVLAMFVAREGARYLVASRAGRGFIVAAGDLLAEKRTGKLVLNLKPGEEAKVCAPAVGDHVAVVGDNRKLLIFPLEQMPEMARGAGVILQKYRDGTLEDAMVFAFAQGLACRAGDRNRVFTELDPWRGERAQAGRIVPTGFPRSGRFS
ncbi:MAG: DNA topoisomerase 4 subunit A, partial [Acidobacteriota bacterium]|nr:DNA topoisomerase 4 subunit A [Acidobacteriota bacterium]